MKPAPFAFARPSTLEEAVRSLSEHTDAKVLAGGQSLVPLLSMRLASPAMLVDINGLPDLDHVHSGPDGVHVGALARHAAVLRDHDVERVQPLVTLALRHVAHATIRNRGTVVGSVVHADPAAELPAVLLLLGGSLDAVSTRGRRTVEAVDLFAGPMESTLANDEIAVEAFFPALGPGCGVAFEELARRNGDYAMCGVAALVAVDGEGVTSAHTSYLSVNDVPTVVDLTEVVGGTLTDASLVAAGRAALAALEPRADVHATAAYRSHLVEVLTHRVLRAAHDDARRRAA